jgi:serine/threonine protein kinase
MNDDLIAETIAGRYHVIEKIGTGGMGVVYKALDTQLRQLVAVKVLGSQLDDESEQRFVAEARVRAKLLQYLHHPNILKIFDVLKVEGRFYSVAEYVEGRSLAQVIAEGEPFDLNYAFEIIRQVGGALEYVHQHGIVHRDVKPGNILISNEGRILLSDFGLAIAAGAQTRTEAGTIAGTPAYMSPEQVMGRPVDARSDIFSLGAILYELLTGIRPFSGASVEETFRNIAEGMPESLEQLVPTLNAGLSEVVLKALAKEPIQRFPTVEALLNALEETELGPSTQAIPPEQGKILKPLESLPLAPKKSTTPVQTDADAITSTDLTPYVPLRVRSKQYSGAIAWLIVLDPGKQQSLDERPRQFRLVDGFTVGRDTDNDLVLFDYEVWHHHARISLENGRFYVSDLRGPRGTFVNGVQVDKCELHDRDRIGIGEKTLLFIQAVSPADIDVEAKRRLDEFDAVWDQLTSAARHD